MFGWLQRQEARRVAPDQRRRIEWMGYRIAEDGKVVCSTCGGWCGQCGDDHSADSIEAFERKQQSRNSEAAT